MLVVGIAVLSAALLLGNSHSSANADGINTWLDGAVTVDHVGETTVGELSAQNSPSCETESVPVIDWNMNYVIQHYELHCMQDLGAGRIDDLYKIYQPSASSYAFNISGSTLTPRTLIKPINDSDAAMYMTALSTEPYWYLRYAPSLSEYIKYHKTLFGAYFSIDMPTKTMSDTNGKPLKFSDKLAYSDGGNYMVASASQFGYTRVDLQTEEKIPFLPNTPNDYRDRPTDADKAMSPSGRYAAVAFNTESEQSAYFKIVDVDSCNTVNKPYDKATDTCKSYDYFPQLRKEIPGLSKVISLQFVNDYTLNFVAQIGWTTNIRYVRYQMMPFGQSPRAIDYLAMGDSFASGEGAFNYREGTDNSPNKCHQSLNSYPYILDGVLGVSRSVACSGAKINNVTGETKNGEINQLADTKDSDIPISRIEFAKSSFFPGVRAQKAFTDQNPQVITLSIGGNDVGFKKIIQACVTPITSSVNCYELYEDRLSLVNDINSKYFNLVKTYQNLKENDPTRRVYVIGYPYIISATGYCDANVRMSERDREFAVQLTDYLDSVVERAAAEAGVFYVDTRQALDGHKLCDSGVKAVNGLTEGDDSNLRIGNESYHPNKMGQQLLADTIATQTDNLTKPMPKSKIIPAPSYDDIPLLSGAPHNVNPPKRIWVEQNDEQLLFTGKDRDLYVSETDMQRILRSGTVMKATLHSLPVDVGTLTVDANGALVGTLHIPAGMPVGFHTLHIIGQDIYYQDVDVQMSVYVAANANDYDGDGIPNAQDACVAVPQSGQDNDHDGIDDACDPVIEEVTPTQPELSEDGDNEVQSPTNSPTDNDPVVQATDSGYTLGEMDAQTPQQRIPTQTQQLFAMLSNPQVTDTHVTTAATARAPQAPIELHLAQPQGKTAATAVAKPTKTYWLPAIIVVMSVGAVMAASLVSRRR